MGIITSFPLLVKGILSYYHNHDILGLPLFHRYFLVSPNKSIPKYYIFECIAIV